MRVVILLCAMVLVFSVTGLVLELGAPTGKQSYYNDIKIICNPKINV